MNYQITRPLGHRVLVRLIDEAPRNETKNGILLPEKNKLPERLGVVVAVGDQIDMSVFIDEVIWFAQGSAYRVNPDPEVRGDLALVDEQNIYGVVELENVTA